MYKKDNLGNQYIQKEYLDKLFPEGKIWFSSTEAGRILGRSPSFVREAIENKILPGYIHPSTKADGCLRNYYSIHRDNLLLYFMKTANFSEIQGLLTKHSSAQLKVMRDIIDNTLKGPRRKI